MRFTKALLGITLLALVIRLTFALTIGADRPNGGVDADRYHDRATNLAAGKGYSIHPDRANFEFPDGTSPHVEADAMHPPLHSVVLASADVLGFHTWNAHRIAAALAASAGVAVTGVVARRLFHARVGLLAAAVAAVHPLWFQYPGYLTSESTMLLVVPLALLAADWAHRPGARGVSFVALGVTIGLCALTRPEAIVLFVALGLPVALLRTDRRLVALSLMVVGGVLTVGPWMVRNQARFDTFSLSTNGGVTMAGANCDGTYHGRRLGGFDGTCAFIAAGMVLRDVPPGERVNLDHRTRELATSYAREHLRRTPVVALARVARTVGVFRPRDTVEFDESIGSDPRFQWAGLALHLVLAPLAIAGAVIVFRSGRRRALVVLLAGPILAITTAVTVYGATRMRVAAEPAIAILAAVALCAAWDRWGRPRSPSGAQSEVVPSLDATSPGDRLGTGLPTV